MPQFLKSNVARIIYLFLIWRVLLFIIAFFAPIFIPQFGAKFPYFQETLISSNLPHFVWAFGNFDGVHYLRIARDAYAYQYTQAFFPLYPILIKIISYVIHGNLLISALLVSNLSFLAGLLVFYNFVKKTCNDNVALWSCLFLVSFPTSFYFGAVYAEGLFFLMIISAFYLREIGKIWQASAVGALSSATRLVGIFLAPSLIKGKKLKDLIPVLIVPMGLISYMVYLEIKFNQPLYFLTSQSVFGQQRSTMLIFLPQVFWRYLKIIATTSDFALSNAVFELAATLFAINLLLIGTKKVQRHWLIFAWLVVLTPTLTGTLASMPRYILVAFPIFIILAKLRSTPIKILILSIFVILLIAATAFFTQGYWVA
ncbi:hypothetical protein A3B51_00655 [Candidatus Curtissbacteria bacterium RIFCSPLOWO2_01_FULL_41_18]|uniref:Glycosyltransferase RgtA/B/C/D-like domain-containing protein n=2 Tax=Candidatus Curtissiibacteriota TaxID=1752717 RepID=A0A1F5G1G4_9BACT|nr:MAG: hypothetical protein A2696_00575 [Candidatus Curtissbacteria bacterium RIFCSPHIGHO2_01_FULL_41_13]OGE03734.1 MAG: hypothetical protein A3B51_00655 [Candidatus Curtissbacteria bacterium RIFCSPLOWO2_01_FULL_41_18]